MATHRLASPRVFQLVWISTALSYIVCGTVLAAYAFVYVFVVYYTADVIFSVELLGIDTHSELLPYMAAALGTIGLVHLYHLVNMIIRSVRTRSLQFPTRRSGLASRIGHALAAALDVVLPPRSTVVGQTLHTLRDVATSLWNAFDVSNPNYGVMYILRELIQTGIQTQQAYQLSAHIASRWMNHTIVVLLVTNCWAMPLIYHGLRIRSTLTARLVCLTINFALDFVSYFAFPVALLVPYVRDFNFSVMSFDKAFWYKDVWFSQLRNEWPLVFTTSVVDGLSRLLITFSTTRTLRSIAKLLQHHHSDPIESTSSPSIHSLASVVPALQVSRKNLTASLSHLPQVSMLRSRTEAWGHRLLSVWGLAVLLLHVQSSSTSENPQCLLQVRPWFVRRPVCALVEINCWYDSQLTGNASDFAATLDSIDSAWLAYLIIRHCPSVEITPRIQDLSWLIGIKIHNSTLVQWDEHAALTQTHHPEMLFAFVLLTNVSVFPQALYHEDFPEKLRDIEFSFVNLSYLPSQIADRWHPGMFLVMEGLQFQTFPDVLAQLQPSFFSIACNNFSTIPHAVFENPTLSTIILNGNPLSELPSEHVTLSALSVVNTQITRAPLWFDVSSSFYPLLAGSTPLCSALDQGDAELPGFGSEAEMELWRQYVNCTPANEYRYISHYPLADEAVNNPSRIVSAA